MQYKGEMALTDSILRERRGRVAIVTLNKPQILNAWDRPMRIKLVEALDASERDDEIGAIILTGAGDRAFGAGQDLREAKSFDEDRAEEWLREWEYLYDVLRSLSKPSLVALNGLAAGSAFQVALLADFRVGHPDVRMGQPEINSGIASITGAWIMRDRLGIARTTDLALTGRMMDAEECRSIGLINRIVPAEKVLDETLSLANELAAKSPLAMRADKEWLREMTETGFRESIEAGIRFHRRAYASGEPAKMMERFIKERGEKK
jgi:enoyl-CoA hydratase/carnithine racemase